jgi:cytochrome c
MTPHPDLGDEVIKEMVSYIMSLDKDVEVAAVDEKGTSLLTMSPDTSVKGKDLLPGSFVKVFGIPKNTKLMPSIGPNQKPLQAGILPKFDNLSGGDFKELEENFALMGSGYLKIDTAGTYTFHIWSDDGSKLFINEKEVINNDGIHGANYGEVSISMTPGYYSFRLEYFQGAGGRFLSFNWKKPGGKDFEVISNFSIFHKK